MLYLQITYLFKVYKEFIIWSLKGVGWSLSASGAVEGALPGPHSEILGLRVGGLGGLRVSGVEGFGCVV